MKLLVCGGAGFIGSNSFALRLAETDDEIVVLDKLTYAGTAGEPRRPRGRSRAGSASFTARSRIADAVARRSRGVADAIVNFAAETHVDRSIAEPDAFVVHHGSGTYMLLGRPAEQGLRYVQVSTDEVYGSIEEGSFTERSRRSRPPRLTAPPRPARTCSCRATSTPSTCRR